MELVGRINNKHLAKLWNFMVFYNVNSDDNYGDIIEKFQECDEALSELEDQCDHWKTMYANACGDQDVFKESIRLLDTENRRLMAENKDWERRCESMRNRHLRTITTNDKTINQLRTENDDLKKQCEDLRKDNEALKHVIDDFVEKVHGKDDELQVLQKERDELKKDCEYMTNSRNAWRIRAEKDCEYMTNSRNAWRIRAEHAEAEAEELKKKLIEANEVPDAKEEHTITLNMGEATYKILLNILSSKAFGASPEYMRDFLTEFCDEHDSCMRCPLKFSNCDFNFMSDEDLEKLYKIAISKCAWHGDATAEKKINKPEE